MDIHIPLTNRHVRVTKYLFIFKNPIIMNLFVSYKTSDTIKKNSFTIQNSKEYE